MSQIQKLSTLFDEYDRALELLLPTLAVIFPRVAARRAARRHPRSRRDNEIDRLCRALQKIADLPLTADARVRARRIAISALKGAGPQRVP
jgi:hypothetical protein